MRDDDALAAGQKWAHIAALLGGRSDDSVRNRYLRLQKKRKLGELARGGAQLQHDESAAATTESAGQHHHHLLEDAG